MAIVDRCFDLLAQPDGLFQALNIIAQLQTKAVHNEIVGGHLNDSLTYRKLHQALHGRYYATEDVLQKRDIIRAYCPESSADNQLYKDGNAHPDIRVRRAAFTALIKNDYSRALGAIKVCLLDNQPAEFWEHAVYEIVEHYPFTAMSARRQYTKDLLLEMVRHIEQESVRTLVVQAMLELGLFP